MDNHNNHQSNDEEMQDPPTVPPPPPAAAATPPDTPAGSTIAQAVNPPGGFTVVDINIPPPEPTEEPEGDHSSVSTPHRLADATDVVMVNDGEDEHPIEGPPRQRLRMGDTYPIMKGTVYSDEECDGEVEITAKDCGARFIRYVNGLFQYLVRNPKIMGLVLTTVILILFFKYSQQLVLKSVNTALHTHPGLEPSDAMKSRVLSFTSQMSDFVNIAETVAWFYTRDNIVGYDLETLKDGRFLSFLFGFENYFDANVNVFVLYQLPDGRWGRVRCGPRKLCTHTNASYDVVTFNGTNTSDVLRTGPFLDWSTVLDITGVLKRGSGDWGAAREFYDQPLDETFRVISYSLPFKTYNGENAIAVVDVDVKKLAKAVNSTLENSEVIMSDMKYFTEQGGMYVLDAFNASLFWNESYPITHTPEKRVNEIAEPIKREWGGDWRKNISFYQDGLIFQSLTMLDRWVLMAQSPLTLSAAEIEASFSGLIARYEHLTSVVGSTFSDCESYANEQTDCPFLESITAVERSFGAKTRSIYAVYTLKNEKDDENSNKDDDSKKDDSSNKEDDSKKDDSSNKEDDNKKDDSNNKDDDNNSNKEENNIKARSSNTEVAAALEGSSPSTPTTAWGACGCSLSVEGNGATNCYYTDSKGIESVFSGPKISVSTSNRTVVFDQTRRYEIIKTAVESEEHRLATKGYWTKPYSGYDSISASSVNTLSYIFPFEWNTQGEVTGAAVFDLDMSWVPEFLESSRREGTVQVILIDRRGVGSLLGSIDYAPDTLYAACETPNHGINRITTAVYERMNSFDYPTSFHMGPELVNYQLIEPYWGIIEVIPGPVALDRYLPTPQVTGATDALRLIPTGETITLFLYVGGILLAFFLNLLILGCSKLGQQ